MALLKLGTRGSPLALYQARAVAERVEAQTGTTCEIVVIRTSGDRLSDLSLSEAGGKRLFVKEIEDALASGDVDLAVHSSKDMTAMLPDGLAIGATLPREDPRDVIILPSGARRDQSIEAVLSALGATPRIGTSSVRRIAQLARVSPRARFLPLRGNLDTRLRKLDAGDYDALVLAAAGLLRLQHEQRITTRLPFDLSVPAPGQGIIAVEVRRDDRRACEIAAAIGDQDSLVALTAERTVIQRLGGGCQMPIGALAYVSGDQVHLMSVVSALDGTRTVRTEHSGPLERAEQVGSAAARSLLEQGAGEILADAVRSLRLRESSPR
jgi:hydroxymethylbilane synthase